MVVAAAIAAAESIDCCHLGCSRASSDRTIYLSKCFTSQDCHVDNIFGVSIHRNFVSYRSGIHLTTGDRMLVV